MTVNPRALAWFEGRAIDVETVLRMGVFSGRLERRGDEANPENVVVADANGDILVFPYLEAGQEVNAKYRAAGKRLWQKVGGKKTLYNSDVLDDPALKTGEAALVWVEGEPDCLAVIQAGYPFVVSVPDGAPAARDKNGKPFPPVPQTADDIDPEHDDKYSYIFNNWDRLKEIKRHILFTDGDEQGERLRDEIARRLGRVRCSFVRFPDLKGEKPDANEVLKQQGASAVCRLIHDAAPFPVRGIYHLRDFPDAPPPTVYSTGFGRLDTPAHAPGLCSIMLATGMFMVVLGAPGSGKSTWTLQTLCQTVKLHHWNAGIASFEMPTVPYVRDILRTHHAGKARPDWSSDDRELADEWINRHFAFFHIDPRTEDEDPTLEWLIDRAADAVIRDGIKVLLIDPWNELEHCRRKDENETQYANRAIRALKRFAHSYDVLVIVVVHPTKSGGMKESGDMSLYDADGSAAWVNKPDIGIVVDRNETLGETFIHGKKFRFKALGNRGSTSFKFDPHTETFSQ
jgi:twinkle protein